MLKQLKFKVCALPEGCVQPFTLARQGEPLTGVRRQEACHCCRQVARTAPARFCGKLHERTQAPVYLTGLLIELLLVMQFLYIKEAFCPSLEEKLSVLAEVRVQATGCWLALYSSKPSVLLLMQAYAVDGQLNINYAITPAWG